MDVWIVVLLKYIHSLPKPTILLNNIQVRIESMFARIVGEGKFDLLSDYSAKICILRNQSAGTLYG